MILGVGIDLCAVDRMEESLKDGRFLHRFFSPDEQAYILSRGVYAASSAAAGFAAKEAFFKALGTGIAGELYEVSLLHRENGAPYITLTGWARAAAQARDVSHVHVSLTHEMGLAAAFVVLEGGGECTAY